MGKIENLSKYLTEDNHFRNYLSLFRVFICLLIFNKMHDLWGNISILLSNDGFYSHPKNLYEYLGLNTSIILENSKFLILIIVFTLVLLLFGIGKKITALVLFFEIYFIDSYVSPILNGGDNLLIFILMYFIFTNSYEKFVITKKTEHSEISNFISNLAVYSMLIHLCYVYFITGIHKIHSDVWFNGTAIYYILNLERFQSPISYLIKDNGFITTISTYLTLIFEMFFCVLVWIKSFRNIILIFGIFLHLGIFLFMMIFDFEIFFISLYGFFLTNNEWESFFLKLNNYTNLIKNKVYA